MKLPTATDIVSGIVSIKGGASKGKRARPTDELDYSHISNFGSPHLQLITVCNPEYQDCVAAGASNIVGKCITRSVLFSMTDRRYKSNSTGDNSLGPMEITEAMNALSNIGYMKSDGGEVPSFYKGDVNFAYRSLENMADISELNFLDSTYWSFIELKLSGPRFSDLDDGDNTHFVIMKKSDELELWLIIGPEVDAKYCKANALSMKKHLFEPSLRQILCNKLSHPFGRDTTVTLKSLIYPTDGGFYDNPIANCVSLESVLSFAGQSVQGSDGQWVGSPYSPYNVRVVNVSTDFQELVYQSVRSVFSDVFKLVDVSHHEQLESMLTTDMSMNDAIKVAVGFANN